MAAVEHGGMLYVIRLRSGNIVHVAVSRVGGQAGVGCCQGGLSADQCVEQDFIPGRLQPIAFDVTFLMSG